jgi:anti-sigma factor RsiW
MSHLGDRLSALVDDELSHDERDRLLAHLAACQDCRAEAAALRALKRRVGALGDAVMDVRLLARLVELAEPGEPAAARPRVFHRSDAPRAALLMYPDTPVTGRGPRGGRHAPGRPPARPAAGRRAEGAAAPRRRGLVSRPHGRRRAPYVVAGVASFLVVGVAGLSFAVGGGGQGAQSPRVTPPVEMFTVEHSVTTGEVPFANPAATFSAMPVTPRGKP